MLKINYKELEIDFSEPRVMGILNVSPDSFYDGGHFTRTASALKQAEKMILEGASMVDLGAVSTRPGAAIISTEEEWKRINKVLPPLRKLFPKAFISVDTCRAEIARRVIIEGANCINDISGGQMDNLMFETVAQFDIPYIMMHIQGTPATMQTKPKYQCVTSEILDFFNKNLQKLTSFGKTRNIILDPGFGFGKTLEHNYQILNNLHEFIKPGLPLLIGISRKSMIYKLLENTPEQALNGTTVINTIALLKGADILRVHDVKEAMEAVKIVGKMKGAEGRGQRA